jgi:hypothetical protein
VTQAAAELTENEGAGLSYGPNPLADELFFRFDDQSSKHVSATVFSTDGVQVLQQEADCESEFRLDFSALSEGIYFVELHTGSQVHERVRIVKTK